jgi:phosphoadenosine phosphosulfate reductase
MKRFLQNQMFSKDELIADSIVIIQKYRKHEPFQLCFSGGKDSIVLLDLAKRAGVKFDGFMHTTGIDVPEVINLVRKEYPEIKMVKANNFWKLVKKNGTPSLFRRWCCRLLKEHTIIGHSHLLIGTRGEESHRRSHYSQVTKKKKNTSIYPLLYWPEWAIWEYIYENNLPYPKKIYEHFDRVGCIVCPFRNAKNHARYRELFPKQFTMFEKCARIWWERKVLAGAVPKDTFENKIHEWYQNYGKISYWENGGKLEAKCLPMMKGGIVVPDIDNDMAKGYSR